MKYYSKLWKSVNWAITGPIIIDFFKNSISFRSSRLHPSKGRKKWKPNVCFHSRCFHVQGKITTEVSLDFEEKKQKHHIDDAYSCSSCGQRVFFMPKACFKLVPSLWTRLLLFNCAFQPTPRDFERGKTLLLNTGGSLNSRVLQFADPPIRGLFFVTQIPQFAAKNLQFAVFSAIFRKIWQARDQNLK